MPTQSRRHATRLLEPWFDKTWKPAGFELVKPENPKGAWHVATVSERITIDPEQCGGRPCVRGMRIRVSDVLDLLANGLTPEQILEELPDLELEDIRACLIYASRQTSYPPPAA